MGLEKKPEPAVAAVVFSFDLGHVLLIQRGKHPAKGQWSLPGGLLELGETMHDGCKREVQEETGLEIEPRGVVKVLERIISDTQGNVAYHYLIVDFWAIAQRAEPKAGSDVVGAAWVTIDRMTELETTQGLLPVIERALMLARGEAPDSGVLE